ncbi:NADH-quinone oxidoreductase subunit G [Hoyosella sp. G463]|uniref:NADH-quinone oxidoreductase n=1 Tax=Lolliginicoccus lacisalsi TaxID=2742202 RepID=A0A927JCA3_9ACTN|nr:NADH-quinone oxidoreductase subunit G [Lolliginicoccus lacisalsi]MBD8506205.1 NADH-quinone oxidoreductase subunit G [Lolliginicoccus lacisalsi]
MTHARTNEETSTRDPGLVHVTIDGTGVDVPPGTLIIRAAEQMGVAIPRFCDHPLLDPAGACRQCIVEVEGQRKPVASCTMPVTDGMVVHTQHSSVEAASAQRGVMELLLINHPLDCPVCDKGGECPLQNQALSAGRSETRFTGTKRTFPKPIPLSEQVLLDRERCVLCARCTRFAQQIAGDPLIDMVERGSQQQVGISTEEPFDSYFSGNTIQICPVGALTSATYRFRARPYDLVSTPSVCEHCASGCAQRTDHRRGTVMRRLAGDDPDVNEEWNCDKGRFAFTYATEADRITSPLVRGSDGELHEASWPEALAVAARGLAAGPAGVLVGGRATIEDAYAYSKLARLVLGTNDIDMRARPHSREEAGFLARRIAGIGTASYADLDAAPAVLLVAHEPEEESPIVFLRLRRNARARGLPVFSIAPFASPGLRKLSGTLLPTIPGDEAATLAELGRGGAAGAQLRQPGAVILVGERAAAIPGALTAAERLADETGAILAWVPRRAGERGALEAGALPGLLPAGHPVADPDARRAVAGLWKVPDLPREAGRDTSGILDAAARGTLHGLLVGGVDPHDLPDPAAALSAIDRAGFVASIEIRHSAVTARADVVLPSAVVAEKAGTFLTWEGRPRGFGAALRDTGMLPDHRIVDALAATMRRPLGLATTIAVRTELDALAPWHGGREEPVAPAPRRAEGTAAPGEAILASWHLLLDDGRMQDGEPHLAGTAHPAVARLSAATAHQLGASDGDPIRVSTPHGAITLPLRITDMPDAVAWVPTCSPGSHLHAELHALPGDRVRLARAEVGP